MRLKHYYISCGWDIQSHQLLSLSAVSLHHLSTPLLLDVTEWVAMDLRKKFLPRFSFNGSKSPSGLIRKPVSLPLRRGRRVTIICSVCNK